MQSGNSQFVAQTVNPFLAQDNSGIAPAQSGQCENKCYRVFYPFLHFLIVLVGITYILFA